MQIIPQFPSRDIQKTKAFYEAHSFECDLLIEEPEPYLIMTLVMSFGEIEIHFWQHVELIPEKSIASCYIRFDLENQYDEAFKIFEKANLPNTGIPRLTPPEARPWGMREFYLVDLDGNLVKFGIVHLLDEGDE